MFQPTHFLVSRSRKTPVQLIPTANGLQLLTETEFHQNLPAAFEMRPYLGMFCKGVQIIGYNLEPIKVPATGGAQPSIQKISG